MGWKRVGARFSEEKGDSRLVSVYGLGKERGREDEDRDPGPKPGRVIGGHGPATFAARWYRSLSETRD